MAGVNDFEAFVEWVNTLTAAEGFSEGERDYKLELSRQFNEMASAGLSSDGVVAWLKGSSNNIVSWRTTSTLSDIAGEAVAEETGRLTGEGDLGDRLDRFGEWLHETTGAAAGEQTTVASALLMGLDATNYPPYKTGVIRKAMKLAGREARTGPPSDRYRDFLDFCDTVAAELAQDDEHHVDRLDVQGACWIMGGWPEELVAVLLPERHEEFEAWRGSAQGELASAAARPMAGPKWWVNQGATYRQERDGSYIWAPQITKAGHPVAHHTAVRDVRAGDTLIHYADGHIRAVGTATSDGYEADRPGELPDQAWETAGYQADVEYRELSDPVPLSAIDLEVRTVADGPFTSAGAVKQGYLFELPGETRGRIASMLPDLGSSAGHEATSRLWAVYVGKSSEPNLNFSLPRGRWGWKKTRAEYDRLEPGDALLFATGYTGGSPRVKAEEFRQHGITRLILCQATSTVDHDAAPFWPDEDGTVSYPYRVQLSQVDELPATQLSDVDERFGGPVAEAIRLSAINQGRAELVATMTPVELTPRPLNEVVDAFVDATAATGLSYGKQHDKIVRSFVTALATKPFVILTGLSGSGKTRLAQAFGHWLGAAKVIAVRPDWTSPDSLLGFENALSEPTIDGRYAWNVPDTLRFILEARDNPGQPHLLLLDEMNLAHVERYFADVLSGMESGEPVVPDLVNEEGSVYRWRKGSTDATPLPENLFVVGTVNIDETTYMFSPKVLDRANTFEFRVETDDLVATIERNELKPAGPDFAAGFLAAARSPGPPPPATFEDWLREIHEILAASDREFGHRTFQEALRFSGLLETAGEPDSLVGLDLQVAQKVLPRLHGSRRELSSLIDQLGGFCSFGPGKEVPLDFDCAATPVDDGTALPVSYGKLHRMARKLRDNHFVSFAE